MVENATTALDRVNRLLSDQNIANRVRHDGRI